MAPSPALPLASFCRLFVQGPFGTGKTGLALQRLSWLLEHLQGQGHAITVLLPSQYALRQFRQRADARLPRTAAWQPYRLLTFKGLMRQAVELAWPAIAEPMGYARGIEPAFLSLEGAQYVLIQWVEEMVAQAQFDAVTQGRAFAVHRLATQIMDNMIKASMYRYSLETAYNRLTFSVPEGKHQRARINAFQRALAVSRAFRRHCLAQGLVSENLLYELFYRILDDERLFDRFLLARCRHVIADGCEEHDYACHRFLRQLIPMTQSSLCLGDADGGFRYFLGAYREGLAELAAVSDQRAELQFHPRSGRVETERRLSSLLDDAGVLPAPQVQGSARLAVHRARPLDQASGLAQDIFRVEYREHFTEILDWTADEIQRLVRDAGVPASRIVVLAPTISNSLRFALEQLLQRRRLRLYTHRPSRRLNDEPAAQALLALACLAHPHWGLQPTAIQKRIALQMAIEGLEGWRAPALAQAWGPRRTPFSQMPADFQARVQYRNGVRYEALRDWLDQYAQEERHYPLDVFFARIYDELLAQKGFGIGADSNSVRVVHQLAESARTFHRLVRAVGRQEGTDETASDPFDTAGRAYVRLVQAGLLGNLYLPSDAPPPEAVVLSSTYNFIMQDYGVEYQFWIDVNNAAWGQRIHQPLTHPFVLSPAWPTRRPWTEREEYAASQWEILRTAKGLLRRTHRQVYLGISAYGEKGLDHKGEMLKVINRLLMLDIGAPAPLAVPSAPQA